MSKSEVSAAKYTRGPWSWVDGDEKIDQLPLLMSSEGSVVCDFGCTTQYDQASGHEPSEADSRLIAAAPELLEALQKVFVIGDRLVDDIYGHEFVERAKAAIAKATGSAQ